jgi:DNA-binding NarL/FixJ family response regulator
MINVIIADDHKVVRRGIKQLFADEPDIEINADCSNGVEMLNALKNAKFDVAILDISMPGMDGLDTLKEIKRTYPKLSVLIFTMHDEEQYALRVLKAGASGYICKDQDPEILIHAVRKLSEGGMFLSSKATEILANAVQKGGSGEPHDQLSDREYQVMCLIAAGKNLSEIASSLNLSINTISTYRARVLEKLNLNSNVDISKYALRHNLLEM